MPGCLAFGRRSRSSWQVPGLAADPYLGRVGPYLVCTPFPHDFPADGVAFAGVWRRRGGCLFLDLAAVPGAITIGGDQAAATWARSPSRTSCAWARPLTTSAWSSWEARWAAASAGCRVAARRRGPGAAPATPGREGGDGLLPVRLG
jgi:hypothetical protein